MFLTVLVLVLVDASLSGDVGLSSLEERILDSLVQIGSLDVLNSIQEFKQLLENWVWVSNNVFESEVEGRDYTGICSLGVIVEKIVIKIDILLNELGPDFREVAQEALI